MHELYMDTLAKYELILIFVLKLFEFQLNTLIVCEKYFSITFKYKRPFAAKIAKYQRWYLLINVEATKWGNDFLANVCSNLSNASLIFLEFYEKMYCWKPWRRLKIYLIFVTIESTYVPCKFSINLCNMKEYWISIVNISDIMQKL